MVGGHGTSLGCGLGGRRMAVSSSPSKPVSCQRLRTSMLVCARPGGVSSRAGSGRRLPTTALWRSFMAPCRPGPPTWCSRGAVACASKILLLAFVLGGEAVQPPPRGTASSPAEEWPRVPQLCAGVYQGSCRPMGRGVACCHWGGETSSSAPAQITITCHVHVLHNHIEIKAAKNWSKRDTFLL